VRPDNAAEWEHLTLLDGPIVVSGKLARAA
jgi:hypothetical protein